MSWKECLNNDGQQYQQNKQPLNTKKSMTRVFFLIFCLNLVTIKSYKKHM